MLYNKIKHNKTNHNNNNIPGNKIKYPLNDKVKNKCIDRLNEGKVNREIDKYVLSKIGLGFAFTNMNSLCCPQVFTTVNRSKMHCSVFVLTLWT